MVPTAVALPVVTVPAYCCCAPVSPVSVMTRTPSTPRLAAQLPVRYGRTDQTQISTGAGARPLMATNHAGGRHTAAEEHIQQMSDPAPVPFNCPNCGAKYEAVRVEAPPRSQPDREITCLSCGGPLHGRQGAFILKYFLVERRKTTRFTAVNPVAKAS